MWMQYLKNAWSHFLWSDQWSVVFITAQKRAKTRTHPYPSSLMLNSTKAGEAETVWGLKVRGDVMDTRLMIWWTGIAGPTKDSLWVVDFNKLKARFIVVTWDPNEASATGLGPSSKNKIQWVRCSRPCFAEPELISFFCVKYIFIYIKKTSKYRLKQDPLLVDDLCLLSTWEGALNTRTFWGQKRWNNISDAEYWNTKKLQNVKDCLLYLKSAWQMAWDDSFSKILVTGRCSGWFGSSNMLRQWSSSVDTNLPLHNTWRFCSDLTIAWMWCATENWTSSDSWHTGKEFLLCSDHICIIKHETSVCDAFPERYLWVFWGKHWRKESHDNSDCSWMKNIMIIGKSTRGKTHTKT